MLIGLSTKQAILIIEFAKTEPSKEERHNRRVQKILDYENGNYGR